MTVNRQESETISECRAQLESQVSASPSNIGAADVHRDYERVKESVRRISIANQYKVQDSATGIKQDCKPELKVVTKCAHRNKFNSNFDKKGGEYRMIIKT